MSTNRLHSFWPGKSKWEKNSASTDAGPLTERLQPIIENTVGSVAAAIAENPRTSLTVAATLGALAGWFIKRK